MERQDQSDLFDISLTIALFLHAWGKGDARKIQDAVELMSDWAKRREDRLTAVQLGHFRKPPTSVGFADMLGALGELHAAIGTMPAPEVLANDKLRDAFERASLVLTTAGARK